VEIIPCGLKTETMKKLFLLIAILELGFTGLNPMFSQTRMRIQSLIGMPANMQIGKHYNFKIVIKNIGNQSWTGKAAVLYKTDLDSAQTPPSFMFYDTSSKPHTMQPGDTLVLSTSFKPESAHFRVGKNIVVIWPAAMIGSPPVISDTTKLEIKGLSGVGIDEKNIESLISIFPNPATDQIHLIYALKLNEFEYVRIFNMLGEQMYLSSTPIASIPTAEFKSGIYFIEIKFRNRHTAVYRFAKQ
jgi:hypothetical protein